MGPHAADTSLPGTQQPRRGSGHAYSAGASGFATGRGLAEPLFSSSLAVTGGVARDADQWEAAGGGTCARLARELWTAAGGAGAAGCKAAGRERTPARTPRTRRHVGRAEVSSAAPRPGRCPAAALLSRGLRGPTGHPA